MSDCIEWTGYLDKDGYGVKSHHGKPRPVHRVVYEEAYGPIPDGLVIDHTCHNSDESCPGGTECRHRRCVNPDHLEAVTRAENVRRGQLSRKQGLTHCPRGHLYDESNTRWTKRGSPTCRTCNRERVRRIRAS